MISLFRKIALIIPVIMFVIGICGSSAHAASTPSLTLSNIASSVLINVNGADPHATVMLYFPNGSTNSSGQTIYSSIDIGTTDANGSFGLSVAPNSYGLTMGMSIYVAVDGVHSQTVSWPANSNPGSSSGSTGSSLSVLPQTVTLTTGQTATASVYNLTGTLAITGNSNQSAVAASIQSNNQLFINALSAGASTITACSSGQGCVSISVTVQEPTQPVTFSQAEVYVTRGNAPQAITIYGGSGYSLSNSNRDIVSANIDGNNLMLQAQSIGQVTVTVCAAGLKCGSIVVHSVAPGTAIPNVQTTSAPVYSPYNQPPQISSISVSSNNVGGLFFGANSTININFSTNETVKDVRMTVGGGSVTAAQGTDGTYYASYRTTGTETVLPIMISFTDLSGRTGQFSETVGNQSAGSPQTSGAGSSSQDSSGLSSGTFVSYLYAGMTPLNISNSEVLALQRRLKADGFFNGPLSGYFGTQTKSAVEAYQKAHGLQALGVVGPGTRSLLNKGI